MEVSSNFSDEIKRSDFGSLKRSLSPTSTIQGRGENEKSDEASVETFYDAVASRSNDPDELKSKVGSKKSTTTVGSSTITPSETLTSNDGSLRKSPERKFTPLRKPTFRCASTFVITDSSGSSMTFRRFDRTNAQRLLFLEAEIGELEARLEKMEQGNTHGNTPKPQKYSSAWWERMKEMDDLGQRLDRKVEKYYDAISRTVEIMGLPERHAVTRTRDSEVLVRFLSALFAIIFLVTAIVVLYFITRPVGRLGALCGFTIVFAITLISFTNARRHEVFVATAAYAAVLVVFISGNLSASITNLYPSTYAAAPEAANTLLPPQTVVQIQTQTVTAAGVGEILTATVTTIETAVTSVFPTTCPSLSFCAATAAPSATSAAAARGPLQGLSAGGKVGPGFVLAISGLVSLAWTTSLFVGLFATFV